jgi:hypothetical protein
MSIDAAQAALAISQFASPTDLRERSRAGGSTAAPAPVATPNTHEIPTDLPQVRQFQVTAAYEGSDVVYRILDKETGDLILQIPPEQMLEIARGIQEALRSAPLPKPTLDVQS